MQSPNPVFTMRMQSRSPFGGRWTQTAQPKRWWVSQSDCAHTHTEPELLWWQRTTQKFVGVVL
jgi:hypothetical protein